jgi:hypothetical protein
MASQVLSGVSNPTYTNNTGQNVRVAINYMQNVISMSWAGVTEAPYTSINFNPTGTVTQTVFSPLIEFAIGKGIDNFMSGNIFNFFNQQSAMPGVGYTKEGGHFPVEIALAPGQSFSAICGVYNIVVIKEDGN